MFLVVVVLVLSLLHGYVGLRLIAPFDITGNGLILYWSTIGLLALAPLSGIILRVRGLENSYTDLLLWVGYMSLGLFSLAFVFFFIRDILWLAGIIISKLYILFNGEERVSSSFDPHRRQFFLVTINWGIAGVTGTLGAIGLFQARVPPSVIKKKIYLKHLPPRLDGLKIVQISDLHVGPTIKANYVQKVVDQANALEADLIFFTGDMVDGSVEYLSTDVEPLRELQAKYGKYFVTGNHEYYAGVEFWEQKVSELGLKNLQNEHEILEINGEAIAIAGVTDLMAHQVLKSHRSDPELAVKGIPASITTLMLAHQPGSAIQMEHLNVDLMLCGHTHGGQYFPFNLAVARVHPFVAGLYRQGDMQVYVNQGTGYWGPPLRLGIPSEITLIELKSEQASSST
ncbi:MAG: metallophosphoesterase [Candidatus Marinimicrobia bacterium]|nr:metallophosphoesterase [Candidatus Neomarinimicrobiota bacterium]